jgi:histidyl-tRNA synthetase
MIHDTTAQYKDAIVASSHRLAAALRNQNFASEVTFPTKNSAKFLAQLNSKFVVFIGEEEMKAGQFTVKNWTTREQFTVEDDGLVQLLKDQKA